MDAAEVDATQPPPGSPRRAWIAAAAVATVALVLRLAYLHQLAQTPFWDELLTVIDARYYVERARELSDGEFVGRSAAFLSPGYVGFLAVVRSLFGGGPTAAKIAQAVVGAASCGLLVVVGAKTLGLRAGVFGGLLLAGYGMHMYFTGLLLPATLTVFLNIALLAALIPWTGTPGGARLAWTGVLVGAAAATKGSALLLVPALLVIIALWCRREGGWVIAGRAGWFVVGVAAAVTPLTVTNYEASGRFVLLNTTGGRNLYKGNGPHANGSHVYLPGDERGASLVVHLTGGFNPAAAADDDDRFRRETWEYVRANRWKAARLLGHKAVLFTNAQELGVRNHSFVAKRVPLLRWPWLPFGVLVPVGLTGLLFFDRKRHAVPLYATIGVQLVAFTLVFVLARYRLVAVACLAPFAAWQCLRWIELARSRDWRPLALSVAVLGGAVAAVHLPPTPTDPRHADGTVWKFLGDQHAEAADHGQAIAAYAQALDVGLDDRRPHLRAHVLWQLARMYVEQDDAARAHTVLSALITELQSDVENGEVRERSRRLLQLAKKKRRALRAR